MSILNIFKTNNTKTPKARLRFAPSPTGFLHLGNFRTVLFGYLLAKSLKGDFILRLEDTDQKREVEGALDKLIDILSWTGINFDEGPHLGGPHAPYIQTERLNIYNKHINDLIQKGKAYRCFCSEERLTQMRAEQEANKQAPRYDRLCRHLSAEEIDKKIASGEKFVIRQAMPMEGEIIVHDEIRGDIKFRATDLDDHVLIKSNGIPTYQFASVVDDHLMEITHVTRGDEWLSSFPKNILLYESFGWTPPKFIHLPLILNKEGGKLSKRQGDVFVEQYRDKGYLPVAIINFCALLGWHGKGDQEIYSLDELEKEFNLEGVGASPAIFDSEKLDYYNGLYLRRLSDEELLGMCEPYLSEELLTNYRREKLKDFIALAKDRMKKLSDVRELTGFLFKLPDYPFELLVWKNLTREDIKRNLKILKERLENINANNWDREFLEKDIINWLKETGKKNGDFLWPMRVALSGLQNSPGPFEIAGVLGKEESMQRLNKAINYL